MASTLATSLSSEGKGENKLVGFLFSLEPWGIFYLSPSTVSLRGFLHPIIVLISLIQNVNESPLWIQSIDKTKFKLKKKRKVFSYFVCLSRTGVELEKRKEGVTYIACNIEHSFFVTRLTQRVYNRAKRVIFCSFCVQLQKGNCLGEKGKKGLLYTMCY